MRTFINLMILFLFLQGCSKQEEERSPVSIAGNFSFKLVSGKKSSLQGSPGDTLIFNLDTLKSSRSFYFLLNNVGQEDIRNIVISSDNSSFKITPSTIPLLKGSDNKGNSSFTQLISLDIIHGERINGLGFSGLLNMGQNYCNVSVQGVSFDGNNDTTVSLNSSIKVYASVMDIQLYQGKSEYDLSMPNIQGSAGPFANRITIMNFYSYPSLDPPVVMKNTGNVNILLTLTEWESGITGISRDTVIYPLDSVVLKLPEPKIPPTECFIRLNSEGTVFDQQKLGAGNDGNAYFGMWYTTVMPPNYVTADDTIQ